jgi:hypothetical protein
MFLDINGLGSLDLRPVASHKQQPGHEGTEDLCENVMWDLLPGKTLPDSQADGNGRVEVSTTDRSTGLPS